jgi:hypothetical protein
MAKKVLMSKEEAKGLNTKESFEFVKKMFQTKKQKLTLKDFEPGRLLMYKYNAELITIPFYYIDRVDEYLEYKLCREE